MIERASFLVASDMSWVFDQVDSMGSMHAGSCSLPIIPWWRSVHAGGHIGHIAGIQYHDHTAEHHLVLSSISKLRRMTTLFSYALAIATSHASVLPLFHTFMQLKVWLLLWIMLCFTAFLFSDVVFHRSQWHANMSKLSTPNISFPSNLTANFLTIALPMLLTNDLLLSAVKDNSI